ncbi:zinc finger, CCHC-type containing protein [Tanacetum coccineum]
MGSMWYLCDPTPSSWCKTDAHSTDIASNWLEHLPAGPISTWEDLTTHFLTQFFPPGRTAKIQNDILMFQQHQGESRSKGWTRFKDLEHAPNIPSILLDGEGMAFSYLYLGCFPVNQLVDVESPSVDRLMTAIDDDQRIQRRGGLLRKLLRRKLQLLNPCQRRKKSEGPRWMSVRGNVPPLLTAALKDVGKHPRVLARYIENLASSFDSLAPDVMEAHAAHNMLFSLHYPLFQDKLGFFSFDELVNVYDVHSL